jgi:hypothetical protein
MSKRDVDYPVCAVNRDTASPGTAELGEPVTLEVDGFGRSGRVSVWLGDREKPVARLRYTEMPCDCPWVGELTLPKQLDLPTESTDEQANEAGGSAASAEPDGRSPEPSPSPSAGTDGSAAGLYMVQVVLDGTGLTADCPVIIGNPEMAEWYRQDEATAVPSS